MPEVIWRRLRDAVLGSQDGLVSTLGVLTGIVAGPQSSVTVMPSGLVIVTVESLPMAADSYPSAWSEREYLERLLREEEEAIERDLEGERQEIRAMYRARGYAENVIAIIETRLLSDKKLLLEDMAYVAHKELGICPQSIYDPLGTAVAMGTAYIIGSLIPGFPYMGLPTAAAAPFSIAGTMLTLFT
jgi:VIT1/CCC1 family predicted Fe2+/Mn2+ transporter